MLYKYIPDTYDRKKILDKGLNDKQFLDYQIKYRKNIEKYINSAIDFKEYDDYLSGIDTPEITDKENNFYHKFSTLNSKYIFLRNNFHIENLSDEDLEYLNTSIIENKDFDIEFLRKTLAVVMFECGDMSIFGSTNSENIVLSKSIVFELSYQQIDCKTMEQIRSINNFYINDIKGKLVSEVSKKLNLPVCAIKYTDIPKLFNDANEINKTI